MIILAPQLCSFNPSIGLRSYCKTSSSAGSTNSKSASIIWSQKPEGLKESKISTKSLISSCTCRFCSCVTRRHLIAALASRSPQNDPMDMLNKIHPPKTDWYEELYAYVMANCMKPYEDEIAGYKSKLFANLRGKANKILEFGIGTGPNLKYYANEPGVHVFGIDPNKKMEKYARAAAEGAGLLPSNFSFMQAVAEAFPLDDDSVDAVVGTLVLCSVKDVNLALHEVMRVLKPGGLYLFVEHVAAEDGTIWRFVQGILDPLQQLVSDGCHLTRKTGKVIAKTGFSTLDIEQVSISAASFVNPHVFGIAKK